MITYEYMLILNAFINIYTTTHLISMYYLKYNFYFKYDILLVTLKMYTFHYIILHN